jgi:hypothetical protein
MSIYTTPLKTASVSFDANGVWYGVVVKVEARKLSVKVPRLSGELVYGPLDVVAANYEQFAVGDPVAVSFFEGRQDELVVLGRIRTGYEALPPGPAGPTGPSGPAGAPGDWSTAQTVQSTTSRNLISSDAGKMLFNTGTCALTVTSSTAFSVGQRVDLARLNSNSFTVSQGSGAVLVYTPGNTLRAQYSSASIICTSTNNYLLVGDLA